MDSVLVTGGAGFIGSHLVKHFVSTTTATVTVLDKLTYAGSEESLADLPVQRCRLVEADVCDEATVDRLVADSDIVVHCAAETHNDRSLQHPETFLRTNVVGTFTVLQAVRKHNVRLHHISTDEVFGELPLTSGHTFTEDSPYRPSSPYSATKAGADHLVAAWVRSYGVRATISNCSNNYGSFQHVEKFIPRQITRLIDGLRPQVYADGSHVRDWIHVEDHSSAVAAIIERGQLGQTYLIGADCQRSNRDIAATLLEIFGRDRDDIEFVADRPGHDLRYAIDASKLRAEIGWTPRHTEVEDGLAGTVDWFRANESWWRRR